MIWWKNPNFSISFRGISRCLNDFLGRYSSGETIIIPSSIHCLDSQRLDWNVTLLGLAEDERPVFKDRTPYWYFFKITGDNVIIRNLVVEMRLCHTAIFISEGVTELDSVIMKVERSIKSVAIVVEYNASLVANRCRFVDFDVAIFCLPGSAVELTGCIFENNETCVEVREINSTYYQFSLCISFITFLHNFSFFVHRLCPEPKFAW